VELRGTNWSVARPVTNPAGSTSGRVLAAPRLTELVVTKDEDVASIPFIQEALVGDPKDVQIDFVRTGQDPMEVYLTIKLEQVMITGLSQLSSGDRPVESLTLNYAKASFEGTQMDSDGSGTSPSSYGWDLIQGAPA
jgi:type VI secretion system secreted protein Hcp